jgi:hypothetical protein
LSSSDSSKKEKKEPDEVLTGTTLDVYKCMVTIDRPVGPRELQRLLPSKLKSPANALHHLSKLVENGLAEDLGNGTYQTNAKFLKHYKQIRRYLIPRYAFYASLASALLIFWPIFLFLPQNSAGSTFAQIESSQYGRLFLWVFSFGVIMNVIFAALLWFETLQTLRRDKI